MHFREGLNSVELHIHLDGAVRPRTLYDLAKHRGIPLNHGNFDEFAKTLLPKLPYSLPNYLQGFQILTPVLAGDKNALARITHECLEDCVNFSKLFYVEIRFAPHILTGPGLDADGVTRAVLDSMKRGSKGCGIKARVILCILRDKPETAEEVLALALKYQPHGVVAIDLCGDESNWTKEGVSQTIVDTFERAMLHGVHRTVHAGENSPAESVIEAIQRLHAERIGHGYHLLDNPSLYDAVREASIHFEVCPTSSLVTGAVDSTDLRKHPVHRFAEDNISFSLNTDGPSMTTRWLQDEYRFCQDQIGLSSQVIEESKRNAVEAAFMNDEEKEVAIKHLRGRV